MVFLVSGHVLQIDILAQVDKRRCRDCLERPFCCLEIAGMKNLKYIRSSYSLLTKFHIDTGTMILTLMSACYFAGDVE
jgi:hypothetical protein